MHLLVDKIFNSVYNEIRCQVMKQDEEVIFSKTKLKQKVVTLI